MNAGDVNAGDVNAGDVNAGDMNAGDMKRRPPVRERGDEATAVRGYRCRTPVGVLLACP
ncbi:hypothetical protein [Streptomyces sp. DH41]|uniref:hypothetical protein n=1 Tax=Streptomyces sp. DH41 TaxID=3040125 RepID=UPI003FA6B3B9